MKPRALPAATAIASPSPATLLTVEELAAEWKVAPRTVRAMCARGELPYIRLGDKLLRFARADLDRFLAASRQEPR